MYSVCYQWKNDLWRTSYVCRAPYGPVKPLLFSCPRRNEKKILFSAQCHNFVKSFELQKCVTILKNVSIFCHAKICSKFKKYSLLSKMFVFFKKIQDLKKCIKKFPNSENILDLHIGFKIEKNVCIKGTHFLKFFCMFNTSSHLKKLLTT